jgi:hypothetical protein
MEQILIYSDFHKSEEFTENVNLTASRCNELINQFETFQPWQKVTTIEHWKELVKSPEMAFDSVLLSNVNINVTGGRKVDPEPLAKLLNIERDNFLNITSGKSIKTDCTPCNKTKIRAGKSAISYQEYNNYSQYMNFDEGLFTVNVPEVEKHKETFNIYATTEKQIECYQHWQAIASLLNNHDRISPIKDKLAVAKGLHLQLSKAMTGDFVINEEYVRDQILKLQ